MKRIIVLCFMIFTLDAWAVCFSPISRTNINGGQIPTSTKYNADFNSLYDKANDLPGDCFADNSLRTSAFADNAVTTAKIANSTIESSKFASGVMPTFRKPVRIRAYTSNATWVRGNDVGSVMVMVQGGGGASISTSGGSSATAGGASSFGTFCSANGGAALNTPNGSYTLINGAAGGSATGGDINITGASGEKTTLLASCYSVDGGSSYNTCVFGGRGGKSVLGNFGNGGSFYDFSAGGGAGGFCMKSIDSSVLPETVAVTVGSAGSTSGALSPYTIPASKGIVLIYEYGK